MCEAVVFVARPRHTDRRRLVLARDLLTRAAARVIGVVSIGQSLGTGYGSYYGYATTGNGAGGAGAAPAKAPATRREA
jgi:hypothetical protein